MANDIPRTGGRMDRELTLRLMSALVLGILALCALWAGGWFFAALVAVVSALILHEWGAMSCPADTAKVRALATAFVALTVVMAHRDVEASAKAVAVLAVALLIGATVRPHLKWLAGGVVYAALPGIAAVMLRGTSQFDVLSIDFVVVAFLFILVWGTDTAAYFSGRTFGGPKLAPRFSPKKTWSGAIGGALAAVLLGLGVVALAGLTASWVIAALALVLSVASQIGDLAESALKRKFGVKDSSNIIPGHGGIMDRVDGLVVALVLATAIGLLRGGDDLGAALLVW